MDKKMIYASHNFKLLLYKNVATILLYICLFNSVIKLLMFLKINIKGIAHQKWEILSSYQP